MSDLLLIDYDAANVPSDPAVIAQIPTIYNSVLDDLLTLPHVKANLIESQPIEKKWQLVCMYNQILGSNNKTNPSSPKKLWEDGGKQLLESIEKAKSPDILLFSKLKLMLSTASKEFMEGFVNADGMLLLVQTINSRLHRPLLNDFDIAILYEILLCCKVAMNNSVGMDAFLQVDTALEAIARCVRFEHKLFVLQVLELLSVCCYYSLDAAKQVYKGFKVAAKSMQEGAFASFSVALIENDVEVKGAALKMINSLLSALEDSPTTFESLKIDLNKQLFGERYVEAVKNVDKELLELKTSDPQETMIVSRLSMTVYDKVPFDDPYWSYTKKGGYLGVDESIGWNRDSQTTPRTSTPRRSSLQSRGVSSRYSAESEAAVSFPVSFDVLVMSKSITVSPTCGTMAGRLIAAKTPKFSNSIVGSKKTRFFELNCETFMNVQQKKKPNEGVPISSIVDIRPYTTNAVIASSSRFAFEFDTPSRTYAFGCEDELTREKWVVALNTAREIYIINNSTYKTQLDAISDLTPAEVLKYAEIFKKQGALFNSIVAEKQTTVAMPEEFGINTDDVYDVSCYLQSEMLAAGLSNKLLAVMQEFLLIPAGAVFAWDAIHNGTRKIRKLANTVLNTQRSEEDDGELPNSLEEAFEDDEEDIKEFAVLLRQKADDAGSAYKEVSKLAVLVLSREQDIIQLNETIAKLEQKIEKHKSESSSAAMGRSNLLASQLAEKETLVEEEKLRVRSLEDRVRELENAAQDNQKAAEIQKKEYEDKLSEQVVAIEALRRQLFEAEKARDNAATTTALATPSAEISALSLPSSFSSAEGVDKFEKYKKMRKVLPEAAVRHKMSMDNVPSEEIDKFFVVEEESEESSILNGGSDSVHAMGDELDKYRRLRKVLSEASVRKKMVDDGIPSARIENFFSSPERQISRAASSEAAAPNPPTPTAAVPEKYAKYERMKKVLPLAAVRQKMVADGFPPAEILAYLGEVKPANKASVHFSGDDGLPEKNGGDLQPPEGMSEKKLAVKPAVKLKGLFWSKMPSSEVKGTIFYRLSDFLLPSAVLKELDGLFTARLPQLAVFEDKASRDSASDPSSSSAPPPTRLVSVLDPKRLQNVLIFMGKMRLAPEELMNLIVELDPDNLTHEMTTMLINILPSQDELNAAKSFPDYAKLDQASKLCYQLQRIPRLRPRLHCHEVAFSWHSTITGVSTQLGILQSACEELSLAQRHVETIFAIILAVGNYMNADTKWGNAYGFQLDTINKLNALKATKSTQGSLMHVVANLVNDSIPEFLPLSQSWVALAAATEISLNQLLAEVTRLEQQALQLNNEYLKIKEERMNEGLDGILETNKGILTHALQKRLDQFLRFAKPKMNNVKVLAKSTEANVEAIMATYGQKLEHKAEEDSCKQFFITVTSFFRSLRVASEENFKRKKAQEKAARDAREAKAKQDRAEQRRREKEGSSSSSSSSSRAPVNQKGLSIDVSNKESQRYRPHTVRVVPKENIFETFHTEQEATTDAVVADFLNKRNSTIVNRSPSISPLEKRKKLSSALSKKELSSSVEGISSKWEKQ